MTENPDASVSTESKCRFWHGVGVAWILLVGLILALIGISLYGSSLRRTMFPPPAMVEIIDGESVDRSAVQADDAFGATRF